MTFLELVRAAISESSSGVGSRVTDFENLRHSDELFVAFVRQAWLKIQESHRWLYNRHTFELSLQEGKREYNPSEMRTPEGFPSIPAYPNADGSPALDSDGERLAATNVRRWFFTALDGGPAFALSDLGTPGPEGPVSYGGSIAYAPYSSFRRQFLNRPDSTIPNGKPVRFTAHDVEPRPIIVHPTPNASGRYILYGECQRSSQVLEATTDVPFGLPSEYHEMIKWRAIMLKSLEEQDTDTFQGAQLQYNEIYQDATNDQTPRWRVAEPLAGGGTSPVGPSRINNFADI